MGSQSRKNSEISRLEFIRDSVLLSSSLFFLSDFDLSELMLKSSNDKIHETAIFEKKQLNQNTERWSFLNKENPVITGIIAGQTPDELIAAARNSEADGAGGIAIDLFDLKPEFRNTKSFSRVINSVNLPFMFYFYRNDRWSNLNDGDRQEVLLYASQAGASMIDVMGDLFSPSPKQITFDQKAIDQQKRLIDRIHEKGSDVVMSSHTESPMTTDEVVEHLQELESRGPDVVKIVTTINTEEEFLEALKTTIVLNREMKVPFIHLCTGEFSRPHRFMCPILGVSILFAVPSYSDRYLGLIQPTIKNMKEVLSRINWNIKSTL